MKSVVVTSEHRHPNQAEDGLSTGNFRKPFLKRGLLKLLINIVHCEVRGSEHRHPNHAEDGYSDTNGDLNQELPYIYCNFSKIYTKNTKPSWFYRDTIDASALVFHIHQHTNMRK